jgi:Flp pilus assembly protein TadD
LCLIGALILLIRRPPLGFLAMWFFTTLAPTSSFAPIAAEVGADRRMYVPAMGLVALFVVGAWLLIERVLRSDRARQSQSASRTVTVGAVLLVLLSVALGARTMSRNRDYSDELRLSQATLDAWPSAVAHDMVGLSLVKLGRHDGAVRELRQAVEQYPPSGYDLGAQLFLTGQLDEAASVLQRFIQAEPGTFTTSAAHTVLGRIHLAQHRGADAVTEFGLALSGPMPDSQAHVLLAEVLLDQQQYAGAIDHYRAYLDTAPQDGPAFGNLGIALASANRTADAVTAFRRAADLQPNDPGARENLARMLIEAGDASGAAAAAQQATGLNPSSAVAHDLLGQALAMQHQLSEARGEFQRAIQLDPNFSDAREHLRRVGG